MTRRPEITLTSAKDTPGLTIQIYDRTSDDMGGTEPKFIIDSRMKLQDTDVLKKLPIPMIEKYFPHRTLKERYVKIWQRFNQAGIPVIPSMYHAGKSIFMPDLRVYGWELYGKSKWQALSDGQLQSSPSHDLLFLSVMRDHWRDVVEKAKGYSKIATNNKLGLPGDGEAFITAIHESGNWKIFTLDLTGALLYQFGDHKTISEHNDNHTFHFIEICSKLEQGLRSRYQNIA